MGSPLSSLLSDIFMDNLENKVLNSTYGNQHNICHRYVDDIFDGFLEQIDKLIIFQVI